MLRAPLAAGRIRPFGAGGIVVLVVAIRSRILYLHRHRRLSLLSLCTQIPALEPHNVISYKARTHHFTYLLRMGNERWQATPIRAHPVVAGQVMGRENVIGCYDDKIAMHAYEFILGCR